MSEPIYEDPVVAEIHAIRAQMLAECGGDHHKLMEKVREHERASGRKVIPPPPATQQPCRADKVKMPRTAHFRSPHLADPSRAAFFELEVTEEGDREGPQSMEDKT
jgi:hypothetical protein